MDRIVFIDKPKGITSFDLCYRLRKVFGTKKIGHTGTLDPNASGLMCILVDNACKVNQFLVSARKTYRAEILLGIATDTLDIDGNITLKKECRMPEQAELEKVMNGFIGSSIQEVPMTSAVKINGRHLYAYQREAKTVEIPKREIEVYSLKLIEMNKESFIIETEVSSGTYIRALARDILAELGLIGTLKELRRLKIDDYDIAMADSFEAVSSGDYHQYSIKEVLEKKYPKFETKYPKAIREGRKLKYAGDEPYLLITYQDEALAIYKKEGDVYLSARGLF